jgi:hypothetical protein
VQPVGRRREAAELGCPIERLDLPELHDVDIRDVQPFSDIGIFELDRLKNIVCADGNGGR